MNGSGFRYGYDEKDIHAKLLLYGFSAYTYNPFRRELTRSVSWGTHNIIYLRDHEFVMGRIRNGKAVRVNNQLI